MPDDNPFADNVVTSTLPEELRGQSPEQISAYYETKLSEARDQVNTLTEKLLETPVVTKPEQPVKAPATSTTDTSRPANPQYITRSEFDATVAASSQTLADSARIVAASKHTDWGGFEGDIVKIAKGIDVRQLTNPLVWEEVYYSVKGRKTDDIVKERMKRAAEPVSPAVAPQPKPTVAIEAGLERELQTKLNIPEEAWLKQKAALQSGSWKLPLTYDSRR